MLCKQNRDKTNNETSDCKKPTVFIVQAGIGKSRTELFQKQIQNLGGECCNNFDIKNVTHIVVDEKMDLERLCRILKISLEDMSAMKIVKSLWLSASISHKRFIDTNEYEIAHTSLKVGFAPNVKQPESDSATIGTASKLQPKFDFTSNSDNVEKQKIEESVVSNIDSERHANLLPVAGFKRPWNNKWDSVKDRDDGSDYEPSGDEEDDTIDASNPGKQIKNKGKWICTQSSANSRTNCNEHITDKLEEMVKTYQSMNDKWRVLGYQKAIIALKNYPKPISSFEEAKSLHGVGDRLAEKIWEIAESGQLRKLKELTSLEETQALSLFMNIWGAGPHAARAWVIQGCRTLDDLKEKGHLNKLQQIGLKYYDELLERMSRDEVERIENVVREGAFSLQPGLEIIVCGSYRRGKPTCGDVDILITHPDGKSHVGIFAKLLSHLHETGFLTDDLVSSHDGLQQKYLGVCKLPEENSKHRRLDIIVVPYSEFAPALVYFTGSAHLNRSMRNLAIQMNMSLNEHALYTGVVRSQGVKTNRGTPLHTPTEESIFQLLGVPFRPPEERDF